MAHDSEIAIRARVKLNISIFENNQCRSVVRERHDISSNVERRQLQSRVCHMHIVFTQATRFSYSFLHSLLRKANLISSAL